MSLSFGGPLLWQIRHLVANLNKKNFTLTVSELNQLVDIYGLNSKLFVVTCLVREINFKHPEQQNAQHLQLLQHEILQLSEKTQFPFVIVKALTQNFNGEEVSESKRPGHPKFRITEEFITEFCTALLLTVPQAINVVLGFVRCDDVSISDEAVKYLKKLVPQVENHPGSLSINCIHNLLSVLREHSAFVNDKDVTKLCLAKLNMSHPKLVSAVRIGYRANVTLNSNSVSAMDYEGDALDGSSGSKLASTILGSADLSSTILDFGYALTSSVNDFRAALGQFGRAENKKRKNSNKNKITEKKVARLIGAMTRTVSGLDATLSANLHTSFLGFKSTADSGVNAAGEKDSSFNSSSQRQESWNADVVGTVIREDWQSLDWVKIVHFLDHPEFIVPDANSFRFLMQVLKVGSGWTDKDIPYDAFFSGSGSDGLWENTPGQLSLLKQAVVAPASIFTFAYTSKRQSDVKVDGSNTLAGTQNHVWCSLDLIQALLLLANTNYDLVRELFDHPLKNSPELLLLGIAQIPHTWNQIRRELVDLLLPRFIGRQARMSSSMVLRRVWTCDPRLMVNGLARMCLNNRQMLSKVLPIASALVAQNGVGASGDNDKNGCLAKMLDLPVSSFTLDLATNASNMQSSNNAPLLELEAWLNSKLCNPSTSGFVLGTIVCWLQETQNMPINSVASYLKVVSAYKDKLDPQTMQAFSVFQEVCLRKYPQLANSSNESDIEEQANSYFQKIYTSQQSIEDVVKMLKRFKVSSNPREKDIFACMIHNLFDEYRFFDKYPEKELRITGILFGALIQHQLVSSITLGIALRYVLEALRKAPENKMYRFGKYALEQFMSRLPEWPQYCAHIVQIPHLREAYPDLVAEIQRAMHQSVGAVENVDQQIGQNVTPSPGAHQVSSGAQINPLAVPLDMLGSFPPDGKREDVSGETASTANNFDDLEEEPVKPEPEEPERAPPPPPPQDVLDKINFVVNNITAKNVTDMVNKARPLITEDLYDWFAHFLVTGRIANQANYHQAYYELLRGLNSKTLMSHVLKCSCRNVKRLLKSDEIRTEVSERSVLKTLGSWLGKITLAQSKPLLQRDLDIKEMLYKAYEGGRLIAVLPFIAKILEWTKDNRIFRPPNPWTMGLMNALREVYEVPDLKLFLKFEVEILCKNLNLDPKKDLVPPGLLLRRRKPNMVGNRDFTNKSTKGSKMSKPPTKPIREVSAGAPVQNSEISKSPSVQQLQVPQPTQFPDPLIPNLANYVHINPTLTFFQNNPKLCRVVPLAVDRAIREIISPVVERSVTIACITTRELVTKDFAMEPNEDKMRKAAHLMVSNLAGSLALVTCKEPLRVSISQHLRTLLASIPNTPDRAALEQILGVCASENLELGCMLIEKASTEKAMRDIDEAVGHEILQRRKRVEKGGPFYDVSLFASNKRFPRELPDPLRPSQSGLKPFQLHVYESFVRLPRHPPPVMQEGNPHRSGVSATVGISGDHLDSGSQQQGKESLVPQVALDQLLTELEALDSALGTLGNVASLAMVPIEHDVIRIIRKMQSTGAAVHVDSRDSVVYKFGEAVFKKLCSFAVEGGSGVNIEALLAVLEFLNPLVSNTLAFQAEVMQWAGYRFNKKRKDASDGKAISSVLSGLLRVRLLRPIDLDQILSTALSSDYSRTNVEIVAVVTRRCLLVDRIASSTHLRKTLEALRQICNTDANLAQQLSIPALLQETASRVLANANASSEKNQRVRDHVTYLLDNWMMVYNGQTGSNGPNEKAYTAYLQLLQQQGLLKCDQNSERFFMVLVEMVRDRALATQETESVAKDCSMNFTCIDAFTKLIILLLKYMDMEKIKLLEHILNTVTHVIIRGHEVAKATAGGAWDQRPYFRIFASLLCNLAQPDPMLESIKFRVHCMIANTLHMLRPSRVGGFAFAWLELISHRSLMPSLLLVRSNVDDLTVKQKGWTLFKQLLIDLFQSMQPYLEARDLTDPIRVMYKGMLRVLLVLLHDFPEFLSENHFSFCDVIPTSCIQLRNLILSAFPRNMRLPDPLTPNLKVDHLPEISQPPAMLSDFTSALHYNGIKSELDTYLNTRTPAHFPAGLAQKLLLSPQAASARCRYNVNTINALVLYIGTHAIPAMKASQSAISSSSASMDIYLQLVEKLDMEGKYLLLNAIANQLRFPNSHTYYFSCLILFLFQSLDSDQTKEQITRILLERLIVHRPHPWGLLITFIELIKNPRYQFWKIPDLITKAPEIERLFESVARSCMGDAMAETLKSGETPVLSGKVSGGASVPVM